MVYATTIPNFKNTLMKIKRREYVKDSEKNDSSVITSDKSTRIPKTESSNLTGKNEI